VRAFFVYLRLVVLHPKYFCRRKPRHRRIGGNFYDSFFTQRAVHLFALGAGSLVAPYDGRAQYVSVFIKHDKAVHLTGQANARHLACRYAAH
jgi:hypothetical protein